jgi:homoserine/homoserine lactone efflux protein
MGESLKWRKQMSIEVWLTFLLAAILLSVSPGAGAVNTMANTMKYGFKASLIANLGLQVGSAFNIVMVGLGLGALLAQSELAFSVIKWVGVAYLIFLGYQKFNEVSKLDLGEVKAQKPEPLKLFTKSVIVNMTNPKSIVFLVALLPQFMNTNEPQINQIMLLGTTMLVVDTVVMIGYSLLATRLAHLIKNERHVRIQNRIFGSMFMGAGSLLAVASHN